jgi:hypothetical protein
MEVCTLGMLYVTEQVTEFVHLICEIQNQKMLASLISWQRYMKLGYKDRASTALTV